MLKRFDLNQDGLMDIKDRAIIQEHLGQSQAEGLKPDITHDGKVNQDDLDQIDTILGLLKEEPQTQRAPSLEPKVMELGNGFSIVISTDHSCPNYVILSTSFHSA